MNKGKLTIVFVLLTLLALSWGCSGSGNGGSGVLPEAQPPTQEMRTGTGSWGTYQVTINANTKEVDITMLRQADLILNVLGFMEPPPLQSMNIDWDTLIIDDDNSYIGVDVILTHPIPGDPVFKGFDVRAICFGPELLNADGYTILMNPGDFAGVPFGYIDGLLGTPNSVANYDDVWGYKYFCDGLGQDDDLATFFTDEDNLTNRGLFSEGATNRRHYDLSWEESDVIFYMFNYAIYANYNWPVGDPPFELDSFEITTANSQEAFCASAWVPVENTMYWNEAGSEGGGMITLDVEVWDWQDASVQLVTIESLEAGVIAQTASDADSTGSTSKSWIHTFTDVPAVPTTVGDLDILITITDPVTFGEAWFFELLDPGHDMYDDNLWCTFVTTATVAPYTPPSGGWTIKDTGALPPSLPAATEKNFSVNANDGFSKAGIYYFTDDVGFDISYYDMTYSGPSTLLGSLVDPFFGNIGGILINVAGLGSIEVPPMGAVVFCNRSTNPMTWGGYNANGPVWWSSAADFPSLSNGYIYFNMAFVDLEYANVGMAERVWGFWRNYPAGVDGATYYLNPSYGQSDYSSITGYFTVDHSSAGVDGQISKLHVKRMGIDYDVNPDHLSAPADMMWYYIEQDPGNPSVEVCGNAKTFAFYTPKYTIDDDELDGLPVDCSVLSNWTDEWEDVEFNQLALLEDYEDGTWTVSWWEWDGTAMQLIQRHNPIDGTPHNLDIDNVNNEVHVWATDGGTTSFWIFHYN